MALAYALVGWLVMVLAVAPAYAAPMYPSAGLALVAVLVYRWPGVVGTALGAFAANFMLDRGDTLAQSLGVPLAVGLGAALQALAGAALTRRVVRQPMTLGEPRDIARFYTLAFLVCGISASISTAALVASGAVAPAAAMATGLTWWLGDGLGTLIGAPIALTLIGQPREEWAPRRRAVGLTLTLVTVLLGVTIGMVTRRDQERMRTAFERDAASASAMLAHQLDEPLRALEALHSVVVASEDVSPQELRLATRSWLEARSRLRAAGLTQRVHRADVPAFEAAMRAQGLPGFRVFERGPTGPSLLGSDLMVIRAIEPMAANAKALGVNALSIPASRAAMEAAIRSARPAATAGFELTQSAPGAPQTGVVVYRAIYGHSPDGVPDTEPARIAATTGVAFVTLRLDDALRDVAGQIPPDLEICLVDTDAHAEHRRLTGAPGCDTRSGPLRHVRAIAYAGRHWQVRVFSRSDTPAHAGDAWLFAVVGLAAVSVLGALLLTVTGRARRIEAAVQERTFALQQEVREREQAEAALRTSEQRFRSVFNNVPIGVVYTDLRGNIKEANPFFCQMTGYSLDELTQMSSRKLTHPEDWDEGVLHSRKLVNGEVSTYRRHKRYLTRDGQTMWVQNTYTLMPHEEGRPLRMVAVVEDITEHLRLAEAERAREAAELSNRAKSEFLSRMSHELRTPLNAMLGFAQLLDLDRRHSLADAQRSWVAQIQQAGWHLLEMINDVLDLSRIESGTMRLSAEALSLPTLLAATQALVEGDAAQRGIVISRDLHAGAERVLGDNTRVKQILTNLLSNAVKYNTERGRIHVSGRRVGEQVEIAVTDTGLGMTADQLNELFQPFNRLGRERSQVEGTGIGLVISQRLAELMGGSLTAHSRAGEGSSFILTLPAAEDPDTERSELDGPSPAQPAYHRRVVHYVEDNETNVEVMRGVLAQRPQVVLKVSVTGLDGLAAIRAARPDVVLLDMHLPDIDGMELLRHLKADAATQDIPVVVVSADALGGQIDDALQAGAVHYLTKPVSVSELLRVVDQLLERTETRFG